LVDDATGTALVYNGEIFNFRELRVALAGRGHAFAGKSDTEVLLRAYLEWGTGCLDRISGMYAFAIHDPVNARILLARDRLGIKPLFYHLGPGFLLFASTCSALRSFPQVGSEIDLDAVSHYLTTIRTTLGRRTLLRDICALLPGEYLVARVGDAKPVIKRYWDLPVIPPDDKEDPGIDGATDRIRELVHGAVASQLVSDVPVGGFLSGGIDSSVLSSLAHGMMRGAFQAYSVGYDAPGYNEWPFIRKAAEFHGMKCTELRLDQPGFQPTWRALVRSKGLPISTPNEIAICHLAKAVRKDFTVALTGEGADEIFGGYVTPYFSAFDYDRARHTAPAPGETLSSLDRSLQRAYRRPYLLCRPDHYFLVNSWIPFERKRLLLKSDVWDALDRDSAVFDHYEEWFDRFRNCSTFDAYMQIHARINLEGLLFRVDSSTMAASVEARVPFTDHRIAEYVFGLPDRYKIDWRDESARAAARELNIVDIDRQHLLISKVLLRRAFRARVPPAIMQRPKMSFPVPFCDWFADGMHPLVRDTILQSRIARRLFDTSTLERTLTSVTNVHCAMALWPVVNLCLWEQECGARL